MNLFGLLFALSALLSPLHASDALIGRIRTPSCGKPTGTHPLGTHPLHIKLLGGQAAAHALQASTAHIHRTPPPHTSTALRRAVQGGILVLGAMLIFVFINLPPFHGIANVTQTLATTDPSHVEVSANLPLAAIPDPRQHHMFGQAMGAGASVAWTALCTCLIFDCFSVTLCHSVPYGGSGDGRRRRAVVGVVLGGRRLPARALPGLRHAGDGGGLSEGPPPRQHHPRHRALPHPGQPPPSPPSNS